MTREDKCLKFKPPTGPLPRKTVDIPKYVPFHSMAFTCQDSDTYRLVFLRQNLGLPWATVVRAIPLGQGHSERSEAQHLNEKIRLERCFIDLGRATRLSEPLANFK